jgi:hypothetical protein
MSNVTIKIDNLTEREARNVLNYSNYFVSLLDLDEYLRQQIKHSNLSVDEYNTTVAIRDKLTEIMDSNECSLTDVM